MRAVTSDAETMVREAACPGAAGCCASATEAVRITAKPTMNARMRALQTRQLYVDAQAPCQMQSGVDVRRSVESIMTSWLRPALFFAIVMLFMVGQAPFSAQSPTDLSGSWTLNRQLSQFPQEIGFSASFLPTEPE